MNDELHQIVQGLGRIEGRLAGFIESQAQQDKRLDAHSSRMDKHEDRLNKVEGKVWWMGGGIAALSTAAIALKDFFLK